VDLFPVTGRQHQLRKHLKLIGHPIWGDTRYAPYSADDKSAIKAQGIDADKKSTLYIHSKMCLWALEISFPHPCENRMVDAQIKEPAWYQFLTNSVSEREQMKIDQHVSK
jgi:23S rRNA-/tRNA-specific pseudouridylate synthase